MSERQTTLKIYAAAERAQAQPPYTFDRKLARVKGVTLVGNVES
jgi:hypothetical protein